MAHRRGWASILSLIFLYDDFDNYINETTAVNHNLITFIIDFDIDKENGNPFLIFFRAFKHQC